MFMVPFTKLIVPLWEEFLMGGVASTPLGLSRVSESGIVPHYPYSGRPIYAFFILLVHISVKTCKSSNFILPSVFLIWFYIDRIKTTGFAGVRGLG